MKITIKSVVLICVWCILFGMFCWQSMLSIMKWQNGTIIAIDTVTTETLLSLPTITICKYGHKGAPANLSELESMQALEDLLPCERL